MNRRQFLVRGSVAAAAASAAVVGYTLGIEPHWLEIVHRELPIARLPQALHGRTLAHLSDIHVGPRVSDTYLIESFARLRALEPDIVVATGDFLSYSASRGDAQFTQLDDVLTTLPRGRLATVGILGNHDYGRNWSEPPVAARVVASAERAGMEILRNETRAVSGLDIIGVDDLWAHQSDTRQAFKSRTSDAALALCHNPDGLDQLPWEGFAGWVLAGHTHGGQCKPPFLPAPLLPVRNRRYSAGAIVVDPARSVYISRGMGHLIQARFNVRPEITLFTLRPA